MNARNNRDEKEPENNPTPPEHTNVSTGEKMFADNWLQKFMVVLVSMFALLCVSMWTYSLWGYLAVVSPAEELLSIDEDASLKYALDELSYPHIFAGYEPYYGFGTEDAARLNKRIVKLVGLGRDYSPAQVKYLTRQIAFYIPAFQKLKIAGNTRIVSGDRAVITNLLTRWKNALRTGVIFSIHLTIVSLMLGGLLFVYFRFRLFDKVASSARAGD